MKVIDVGITLDTVTDLGNTTTNAITIGALTSTGNASFDLDSGANSFSILDTGANLIFDAKGTLDDSSLFISLGDLDSFSGGAYVEISGSADKVKVKKQLQLLDYTGAGTYTGTAVKSLSVDASGNVIETDITANPTLQTVTTAGNATTASIDTADISIINQNGTNPSDAGSLYFIESGTTWGTNISGFRLIQDGNLNTLNVQSNLNTVVTNILTINRDAVQVGIGTTTPTEELHIKKVTGDTRLLIENDAEGASSFNTSTIQLKSTGSAIIDESSILLQASTGDFVVNGGDNHGFYPGGSQLRFNVSSSGLVTMNDYGAGTFTGTATKGLAVDVNGNVIETDLSLGGSGTDNYITRWDGTSTLTTSSMYEENEKIGIGTGAVEPSEALEVIGNVEAEEFIGDLRGAVLFKAQAGEAISKGQAVYISGISGNTTIVSLADADDAAKMPAFGVAAEAASLNNPVDIYTFGTLSNIDTSTPGWSLGDEVFVSTTAGTLTNTPPTGESSLLQKMGKVTRVHASQGSIKVMGAGRSNATPNLNEGRLFVGNSSNQAVADGTIHVDIANSRVGINQTTPTEALHVSGSILFNTNGDSTLISNKVASGTTGANIFIGGGGQSINGTTGGQSSFNVSLGSGSLESNTTGGSNTSVGYQSLRNNTSGGENIAIGYEAGITSTTNNSSIYIGYGADASVATGITNEIAIGSGSLGNGSNTFTYGNSSMTKHTFQAGDVIIGSTNTPDGRLHVSGSTNDGTSNIFMFNNSDDTQRMKLNGAGRLFIESSNNIPFLISRPNQAGLIDFQNNGNDGAIGYFGNAARYWSTGLTQIAADDFEWSLGSGSGTFDTTDLVFTAKSGGGLRFDQYGSGTYTGTQTVNLEADTSGNIIERQEERGTFSGTTSATGELTFSHGLGSTPTFVMITIDRPSGGGDAVNVVSKTSTQVTVRTDRTTSSTLSGYYLVSL